MKSKKFKPYHTPKLEVHGKVSSLTQTGSVAPGTDAEVETYGKSRPGHL